MRRVAAVLFGILVGLLLLEGTLQALAYATFRSARAEQSTASEHSPSSGHRVLCVGDSYTYGIGAKSHQGSYPARLQEYLRGESGEDWFVANEGWPSRNSQELNDLLPQLLRKYDPHWVVVLIGINDRWNEARPADAAAIPAEPNAWVWRWRTKRLVQIAWANLRGNPGGSSPPTSAPQGAPDSAAIAARSAPDSTSPANLPSSVATLPPFPAGTDTVSVLRRRLLEVVQADTSKYATPEQRKQVFDIAEEARRLDNEELSIAVVEAYAQLKMHTFAVDEGEAALKTFGESPRLARALVFPLQRTHQEEKALHFAERSVALDSTDAENWRVLASARFVIPDPKGGLLALLEFVKRGGDDAVVARQIRVRNLATTISLQELEQTIQDAGLDQQNAAKVKQLFGAMGDAAETEGELFQHLRAIAAQIKAQGARPLFLNYPTPGALAPAAQNESIARVAQKEGIPYLDLHLLLEQETAGQPRDDFFIADGHCTDRGYDIVAKAVAAKLIELDGQTPSS